MRFNTLLIILLTSLSAYSQNIIKGNLKDEKGKPVDNANIILYKNNGSDIIKYSISNDKGNFSISYPLNSDSLIVEVRCIGFKTSKQSVINKSSQFVSIFLESSENDLPEITIKQEPIKLKSDTIDYDVNSFSNKGDRVILDIIKKIPGIKVTEKGQILYNNKAINKFYVEGKDLLDDRYSIASNNLPSDLVEKIQVLQNHQPIKILDGIKQSDRAAINIRLKTGAKLRLIGNGHLGLGFKSFLRDNDLTLLKFGKKIQYINSFKNNNVGVNLDNEINEQNISSNLLESGTIKQDLVSLVKAQVPPVNQEKYWFNNNSLITSNYLLNLSKLIDLKINVALEQDQIKDIASSETKIYLPSNPIIIDENHHGLSRFSKLLSGLTLQSNTKRVFFTNAVKIQGIWNKSDDLIVPANINQNFKSSFINIVNDLNGIFNFKENLIGFSSYISYSNLPQHLYITPGQFENTLNSGKPYNEMSQDIQLKSVFLNNSFSFGKKFGKLSINNKLGVLTQFQTLANTLSADQYIVPELDSKIFDSSIERYKGKIYDEVNLSIASGSFSYTLGINASLNTLQNKNKDFLLTEKRKILNPNIVILYKFNSFLETNVSFSTSNNLSYDTNPSYILQNYRTLINRDVPLREVKTKNILYTIGYKNIINAIYSNLSVIYSKGRSNILVKTEYDNLLLTKTGIVQDNPYSNLNLTWNINRYYVDLKTLVDFYIGYNSETSNQIQQNLLTDFNSNSFNIGTKINSDIKKSTSIQYNLDININSNSSLASGKKISYKPLLFLKQDLLFKYFTVENFQTNINIEHYYNNTNVGKNSNYFFTDITIQKSTIKPKLDFSITFSNVFNKKNYSNYSYTDNILINSDYNLRGRMLIFRVGFQF